jgi:anti-sigma factor RsiW
VHPSDAALLSLIHRELGEEPRDELEEHVAGCASCARRVGALRTDDADIGRLLTVLDHPLPRRLPPAVARAPRAMRPALAASLALLVAGAAAAAVPGTPVHRWIQAHLATARRPVTSPSVMSNPVPATGQVGSGIEIPAPGELTVSFVRPEDSATVTVSRSDRSDISLRALGGRVGYQVGAGHIVVDNRRAAGRYQLEVPNSLERLTVVVSGRVIFTSARGRVPHSGPDTISLSTDRAR